MGSFALLVICLIIGILLRRFRKLPANASVAFNGFIIYISLPALTLLNVHKLNLSGQIFYPISMAWIMFPLGAALFVFLGKIHGWSQRTIGALILTGCLGNTSFLGFPLLEALYGPHALATGILTDQPGSFMVLSTLGIATASICAARTTTPGLILKRIILFPPFMALIAALLLRPWPFPEAMSTGLQKLAGTLLPLALVSVGLQLNFKVDHLRRYAKPLLTGLLFKLLLAPAALTILFAGLLSARGEMIQITLVQAGMAPMITGAILALEYDLEPELANLMVSVGIPLSLITVPLWAYFLAALK